jgi:cell wall-associated NlpC family hydrolase
MPEYTEAGMPEEDKVDEEMMENTALEIGFRFLGKPYIWGGDDPMAGFDCSGFCIELLKSVGSLPRTGDWTAHDLWVMFCQGGKPSWREHPDRGCLVFWWNKNKTRVIHVELCINDMLSIGASGGGSKNVTTQDAIDRNAYIKVRPIRSRANIAGYAYPFGQTYY